jgi:hypothetical protein
MRVEPFEFISNGGGGGFLSRVKRPTAIFYWGMKLLLKVGF